MNCEKMREMLPEVAAGQGSPSPELADHLSQCNECKEIFEGIRQTMALLDEWHAPEPSPYFDTRMQALLREERAKSQKVSWFAWLRRPVTGMVAVALLAVTAALVSGDHFPGVPQRANAVTAARGTAVGDLELLDNSSDLLQDFDTLESSPDADLQQVNF